MWEFLKSKARKEREILEKQLAEELELKEKLENEKIEALYLIESKRLNDKLTLEQERYYKKEKKRVKNANEVCPKCKSTNIVDKISQLKGEVNGSSYGGYGLFGQNYGPIRGNIDTLEINKCINCTNEWKKVSFNSHFIAPSWENKFRILRLTVEYLSREIKSEEPSYVKDTIKFWSGTNLDLFKIFFEKQNLGYIPFFEDGYCREKMFKAIEGKDDILIKKMGFIK